MPPLPSGVELVAGEQGESCAAACERSGGACAAAALPTANSCNVLRETFACEAGCEPHPTLAALPGYTVTTADKQEQPAFCWTHALQSEALEPARGCDTASTNIQRLCPCSKQATAGGAAGASDSGMQAGNSSAAGSRGGGDIESDNGNRAATE